MSDNRAKEAIGSAKHKYEIRFNASIGVHKRNLFFASLISAFSVLVTPDTEGYKVNLGVISGNVEYPIMIYIGLLLVTSYQVYYFWITCRHSVISSLNISKIENVYMYELASLKAFDYWNALCKKIVPKGWNSALGSFTQSPKEPRENNDWKVRATTQVSHLAEQPELLKALESDSNINLSIERGFYQIDFIYKSNSGDYVYLQQHRDHFWITKKKEIVEYVLPLLIGYAAIIGLLLKISSNVYS